MSFLQSFYAGDKNPDEKELLSRQQRRRDVLVIEGYEMGEEEEEDGGNCGSGCGGCGCGGQGRGG